MKDGWDYLDERGGGRYQVTAKWHRTREFASFLVRRSRSLSWTAMMAARSDDDVVPCSISLLPSPCTRCSFVLSCPAQLSLLWSMPQPDLQPSILFFLARRRVSFLAVPFLNVPPLPPSLTINDNNNWRAITTNRNNVVVTNDNLNRKKAEGKIVTDHKAKQGGRFSNRSSSSLCWVRTYWKEKEKRRVG